MERMSFVAMLFVMALASLGIAVSSSSWGWAVVGIACLVAGVFALRQFKVETETGPETASSKFIIFAFLALFSGFGFIIAAGAANLIAGCRFRGD